MCPVTTLNQYLNIILFCSSDITLRITTVPLYRGVSRDTIARLIKKTTENTDINSGIFYSNSCRSASTSKALANGVSITTLLESASWSTDSGFTRQCLKNILEVYTDPFKESNFGTELLIKHSLT